MGCPELHPAPAVPLCSHSPSAATKPRPEHSKQRAPKRKHGKHVEMGMGETLQNGSRETDITLGTEREFDPKALPASHPAHSLPRPRAAPKSSEPKELPRPAQSPPKVSILNPSRGCGCPKEGAPARLPPPPPSRPCMHPQLSFFHSTNCPISARQPNSAAVNWRF